MYLKLSAAVIAALFSVTAAKAVTFDDWTLTGPGTVSVTSSNAANTDVSFSYDTRAFNGSWTASTTVLTGGLYDFDWLYTGLHSWFMASANLSVSSPVVSSLSSGSVWGGFTLSGTSTVALIAGQTLSFTFGGSNSDSSQILLGTVSLTDNAPLPAVPLPASSLGLLGALGAFAFARKRKKA